MLSFYLWSNYHLCFILKASRKTGVITHVVGEVLSRLSGRVTDSIIASGVEVVPFSCVSHSRRDTDLLPDRGPQPVAACAALHLYVHRPFELQGGRMGINWCLSTHILSQNMEASVLVECWGMYSRGPFALLIWEQLFAALDKNLHNCAKMDLLQRQGGKDSSKTEMCKGSWVPITVYFSPMWKEEMLRVNTENVLSQKCCTPNRNLH